MKISLWKKVALLGLIALAASVFAQQSKYGYVVGTFVSGSNEVERIGQEGKFLHYRFKIKTSNNTVYECVIDVKNGHKYEFPYRIVDMRDYNASYYGNIWSATNAYHPITMISGVGGTASEGALDYIRHKGILLDIAGRRWQHAIAYQTSDPMQYKLPMFDDLFKNVKRIYVFGAPYSKGYGMHLIHQNQGDQNPAHISGNGIFQDGAVIFEYSAIGAKKPVRKMLMVKFDDQPNEPGQSDFSYTTDPDGSGPLHIGQAAPYYEEEFYFSGRPGLSEATVSKIHGPFNAEQIEVYADNNEDDCMSYSDVDLFLGNTPTLTKDSGSLTFSRQNGCINEFVRYYGNDHYYYYINAWDPDSRPRIRLRYR